MERAVRRKKISQLNYAKHYLNWTKLQMQTFAEKWAFAENSRINANQLIWTKALRRNENIFFGRREQRKKKDQNSKSWRHRNNETFTSIAEYDDVTKIIFISY